MAKTIRCNSKRRRYSQNSLVREGLLLFTTTAISFSAIATEGGGSNYLPGFYGDIGMALLPKGTSFINFFAGYGDRNGNSGVMLEMPGFLHKTDMPLLGGNLVTGAFAALSGTLDRSIQRDRNQIGLGDFYLVPAAIHWINGPLAILAFEGVVAPTGRFSKGQINLGRNVWTFDHNVMLTWSTLGSNELSVNIGYMNNLINPATHYLSGDELHFDYTFSHTTENGTGLGVTGSYYRQLTADYQRGHSIAEVPNSEALTIGPVLAFTKRFGQQDVSFSVKWLHEFNVTGRPPDEYFVWRTFIAF